ncbi:hypothetical protein Pve01_61720 [Planomonospora venezuelensis]|uniref:Uncharacterized protein n=1 Tax=Planomonospora venezuelensis TaxID=1999 RepID=A0A841D3F2_PLAVE|nr:hypothetical protein [Planomonospora venezuelensis]GIN04514.1 hypothetical protein Pve01_61720 [Planomonospora venezuelensis]
MSVSVQSGVFGGNVSVDGMRSGAAGIRSGLGPEPSAVPGRHLRMRRVLCLSYVRAGKMVCLLPASGLMRGEE